MFGIHHKWWRYCQFWKGSSQNDGKCKSSNNPRKFEWRIFRQNYCVFGLSLCFHVFCCLSISARFSDNLRDSSNTKHENVPNFFTEAPKSQHRCQNFTVRVRLFKNAENWRQSKERARVRVKILWTDDLAHRQFSAFLNSAFFSSVLCSGTGIVVVFQKRSQWKCTKMRRIICEGTKCVHGLLHGLLFVRVALICHYLFVLQIVYTVYRGKRVRFFLCTRAVKPANGDIFFRHFQLFRKFAHF